MKKYKHIKVLVEEEIAIIILNRPHALNALNAETMSDLAFFFQTDVHSLGDLKGIIITGAGDKAFAAGADINDLTNLDENSMHAFLRRGQNLFNAIEQFSKPVVAAIRGFALGGGCELAMACHLRVAAESSQFGQPEVNLGIIPGYGGTQRLVQLIGKSKALEYLLTADLISADYASKLGLVNKVVEDGLELDMARKMITKISRKGPLAVQKIIETVNAYFDVKHDGFEAEINAFTALSTTDDFREGANAFLEKRKPTFVGK